MTRRHSFPLHFSFLIPSPLVGEGALSGVHRDTGASLPGFPFSPEVTGEAQERECRGLRGEVHTRRSYQVVIPAEAEIQGMETCLRKYASYRFSIPPDNERMTRRLLAHAFEEYAGCAEQPTSQMVGYHSLVPGVAERPGAVWSRSGIKCALVPVSYRRRYDCPVSGMLSPGTRVRRLEKSDLHPRSRLVQYAERRVHRSVRFGR